MCESGLRFLPNADAPGGVEQQPVFAGVISGNINGEHWNSDDQKVDFYDLKADVEALLAHTNRSGDYQFVAAEHSALHPGQTAAILLDDECIGYMGAVHPQFEKTLGLNGRTFVFELVLSKISHRVLPQASEISKFPANRRDIAIVVNDNVPANNILSCIEKFGGNQLVDLNLFDVYKGKGVAEGKKSLAVALTLQDSTRTLEESEIQESVDNIVKVLSETFDASLRI
jgi:phenylalanyl-tRNA synthetase beta chain